MPIKTYDIHNSYLQDAPDSTGITRMVSEEDYISQLQQTDALQTSLNNIINAFGIKGEGAHSKLVIEYVHGLVAENAAINDRLQKLIQIVNNADNSYCMCGDSMKNHAGGGCGSPTGMFDYHYNAWLESEKETPLTDSFTAELRAQGVDEFAEYIVSSNRTVQNLYCEMQAISYAHDMRKRATDKEIMEVIDSMGGSGNKAARRAANLRAGRKG